MRTQSVGRRGLNHQQLADSVRAGQGAAIAAGLRTSVGLVLMSNPGSEGAFKGVLPRLVMDTYDDQGVAIGKDFGSFDQIAMDAQNELVTVGNAGIPAMLTQWLDPKLIEVVVTPMRAAEIAGETKKGDWTTNVAIFPLIESTGEVSAYGDYNNGGNADVNSNFPQRQSFHYQTMTQWGEKELAVAGLANIDLASRKNIASALVLNKFQNLTYFFGVSGLQNYGLLNDPSLPAAIIPTTNWMSATADVIFSDVVRLYQTLILQVGGNIDRDIRTTLAMSPLNEANLAKTNSFGINVYDLLKKNFPGIRVKTAPEYTTASGELVQWIVEEFEGQETASAAFTEKMRAHAIVQDSSSWKQKKSQGSWGTIIYRPAFIAQMLG